MLGRKNSQVVLKAVNFLLQTFMANSFAEKFQTFRYLRSQALLILGLKEFLK